MQTKPNWLKYLLALVAVSFFVVFVLRAITPQEQEQTIPESQMVARNLDGTQSDFQNIVFSGEPILPPKSMAVYQASVDRQKSREILRNSSEILISSFNLTEEIPNERVVTFLSNSHTLYIDTELNEINFSKNVPELGGRIDEQKALETASNFLQLVLPEISMQPIKQKTRYFAGGYHIEQVPKINANFVEIPFAVFVDDMPIYFHQETSAPATILVDSKNQIQRAVIKIINFDYQQAATLETLEISQAIEGINQGSVGSLIMTTEESPVPLSLETIQKGSLLNVAIEYRLDPNLNLIYPFYRFEGQFTDKNGQMFEGELISPAIATQDRN